MIKFDCIELRYLETNLLYLCAIAGDPVEAVGLKVVFRRLNGVDTP